MIQLEVQTQPEPSMLNGELLVVENTTIPTIPKPTLFDFGWVLCEPMDALKTVWRDFGWDMDIWEQELRPHLERCELCESNRRALAAWRKWKEAQSCTE